MQAKLADAGRPVAHRLMIRRFQILLATSIVCWVFSEITAALGWHPSPIRVASRNIYFLPTLLGVLILHLGSGPSQRERMATLLTILLLTTALVVFGGTPDESDPTLANTFGIRSLEAIVLTCLGILTWRVLRRKGDDRERALLCLLPASVMFSFTLWGPFATMIFPALPSLVTLDKYVVAADGALGSQPSFVVGQWFAAVPALALVCKAVYNYLSLTFTMVFLLEIRNPDKVPTWDMFTTVSAAGILAPFFYLLYPVIGPSQAFGASFPMNPSAVNSVLAAPPMEYDPLCVRNAMPSLHFAWMLLVFWHTRPLPRWSQAIAGFCLACMPLATLGLGQHYLFDLAPGVSFALMIQALCGPWLRATRRVQLAAAGLGLGLTLGWLAQFRFGLAVLTVSPVIAWAMLVGSVVVCLWVERGLYRNYLAGLQVDASTPKT